MADVRRVVEAEGLIDTGDSGPAPLSVPEELVARLGPREKERPVGWAALRRSARTLDRRPTYLWPLPWSDRPGNRTDVIRRSLIAPGSRPRCRPDGAI